MNSFSDVSVLGFNDLDNFASVAVESLLNSIIANLLADLASDLLEVNLLLSDRNFSEESDLSNL